MSDQPRGIHPDTGEPDHPNPRWRPSPRQKKAWSGAAVVAFGAAALFGMSRCDGAVTVAAPAQPATTQPTVTAPAAEAPAQTAKPTVAADHKEAARIDGQTIESDADMTVFKKRLAGIDKAAWPQTAAVLQRKISGGVVAPPAEAPNRVPVTPPEEISAPEPPLTYGAPRKVVCTFTESGGPGQTLVSGTPGTSRSGYGYQSGYELCDWGQLTLTEKAGDVTGGAMYYLVIKKPNPPYQSSPPLVVKVDGVAN